MCAGMRQCSCAAPPVPYDGACAAPKAGVTVRAGKGPQGSGNNNGNGDGRSSMPADVSAVDMAHGAALPGGNIYRQWASGQVSIVHI